MARRKKAPTQRLLGEGVAVFYRGYPNDYIEVPFAEMRCTECGFYFEVESSPPHECPSLVKIET